MAAFFSRAHAAGLVSGSPRARLYEGGAATARATNGARPRSIDALLSDAAAGGRLSPEEAMRVYVEAPVLELGAAADARRRMLHPDDVVTYIIDRNVNYTNVCVTRCKFCNFYRPPTNKTEGYVLSREELGKKFQETVDLGGVQILLQGGLNPNLPIGWYEDLFRWMKANFPLAIHGLSPEEIRYIAELEKMPIRTVIERLVAAGLDSIPGGGAEILDDEIRHAISPLKCSTDTWMEVMRQAHALGLRTTATMVFGFGEEPRHLVGHLERLRELQDKQPASPPSSAGHSRPRGRGSSCTTTPRPCATCASSRFRGSTSTTSRGCRSPGRRWGPRSARSGCASAATISVRR